MSLVRTAGTLTVATVLVLACGGSASGPPTLAEAQGYLNQLVAAARGGDFAALCPSQDLTCTDQLDAAGRDAVPPDPPTILGSRTIESSNADGQQTIGGIALTVCGLDGRQRPYRSEVLVFRSGSGLAALNPVYWDNVSVAGGTPVTPIAPPPAPGCGSAARPAAP